SGSSPLADAVTRSTGTGRLLPGSACCSAEILFFTASINAGLSGPRLEPAEAAALLGCGEVAEGLPQKYSGLLKFCPISAEPTILPSLSISVPSTCRGNIALPIAMVNSG